MVIYPDPKGYFDLRCIREDYRASILAVLDYAIEVGTESSVGLMDAVIEIEDLEKEGKTHVRNTPIDLIKPFLKLEQERLADQLSRTQDVHSIVMGAPECGRRQEAKRHERMKALAQRRKVRGKVKHTKADYGGDEYEFTNDFDLPSTGESDADTAWFDQEYGG